MVDYGSSASCSFSVRDLATVSTILRRNKTLNDSPLFGANERTLLLVVEQHIDRFDGFRRTQYRLDYRPDKHRSKLVDQLSPEKTAYYFDTYQTLDFSFIYSFRWDKFRWHVATETLTISLSPQP
jgi:hypothetical protein